METLSPGLDAHRINGVDHVVGTNFLPLQQQAQEKYVLYIILPMIQPMLRATTYL
jgi:hypothetical protein